MKNIKAHLLFILKKLFINLLKIFPINSTNPYFTRRLDRTKNGNSEGNMFSLKIVREKVTAFSMLSDSVNISKLINSRVIIVKTLFKYFIISLPLNRY